MPAPLTQFAAFGPLGISYDERVLQPRAWTFMQSEWAVELSRKAPPGPILELCCGAGQIGLAAAAATGRELVQVDSDPVACDFARRNARAVGIGARVQVRCADVADALRAGEVFPLVLVDTPYLPTELVGRYPDDPRDAIDGGADGLDVLRMCLPAVARSLMPGGAALIQLFGERQAAQLRDDLPPTLEMGELRTHDSERAVAIVTSDGQKHRST